eukprot:scaffold8737_cov124-Isochrysis_galbana.AAC.8
MARECPRLLPSRMPESKAPTSRLGQAGRPTSLPSGAYGGDEGATRASDGTLRSGAVRGTSGAAKMGKNAPAPPP